MTETTNEATTREADLAAISELVATVEHSQNNELPEEFLALFREDAIWTTGAGRRLYGLAEIAAFTRRTLPGGMRDTSVTFELEHVLFVRPDVAAVKLRQRYLTPDGQDVGTPLWIVAKEEGRWLLTACQNGAAPAEEVTGGTGHRPIFGGAG